MKTELRKILVVDDDLDVLVLIDLALSKLGGFEVATCDSGLQALEQMAAFDPDLVVLDVMMPGMDGAECLTRIRQNGHRAPVIFLTAKGQRAQSSLQLLDCIAVLSKPFQPVELVQQVKMAWAAAQTSGENSD